ncbi:CU044_5270 family protein [Streptomyces sp. NPDC002680]|uniref:CU044_5270 family protein n=1 Tax=Streptomyces sp. NPDC002680 TaxID=3364659 RepID=UPI0036CBE3B3
MSTSPGFSERDLPPARHRLLKEHLMTEIRHDSQRDIRHEGEKKAARRNPWLRPAITAGAVATVAALTFVALPGGGADGTSGKGTTTTTTAQTATTLLENIALAAEGTELPSGVRDDQFVYIKSRVAYLTYTNGGPGKLDPVHDRETWLSVDGVRDGLLEEDKEGHEHQVLSFEGDLLPKPKTPSATSYRSLSKLPTDPDKMLAWLYETVAKEVDNEQPDKDYRAFVLFGDLIRETLMPPKVGAALYRAAAKIPGVEVVPDVKDAAGRTGIAVTRTGADGEEEQLIFDRKKYTFLGERLLDDGKLAGSSSVLERAVVDRTGQRP